MRILLTGVTSMIGTALAKLLLVSGHSVVGVARGGSAKAKELGELANAEIVYSNMADYRTLSDKVNGQIDAAVLMAWNGTRGNERMDADMQQKNEADNAALLPELLKLGCRTIMTAGSQAEYGPWQSESAQTEEAEPCPNTEYGKSKLRFYRAADTFCRERGIRLIEPRFFSLYGPEDNANTLIMSLLCSMLRHEPCNMTACVQLWDYLYIDDAVRGLVKLLTENHAGGVYNFGSGDCRQLKAYVEEMHRVTKSTSELRYGAIPYPPTGMVSIHPSVDKLRATGWRPQVSFEQGVRQIMDTINFA